MEALRLLLYVVYDKYKHTHTVYVLYKVFRIKDFRTELGKVVQENHFWTAY